MEFNIFRDMEEKRKTGKELEGKMGRRIDKIEKTGAKHLHIETMYTNNTQKQNRYYDVFKICVPHGKRNMKADEK